MIYRDDNGIPHHLDSEDLKMLAPDNPLRSNRTWIRLLYLLNLIEQPEYERRLKECSDV